MNGALLSVCVSHVRDFGVVAEYGKCMVLRTPMMGNSALCLGPEVITLHLHDHSKSVVTGWTAYIAGMRPWSAATFSYALYGLNVGYFSGRLQLVYSRYEILLFRN
jgi:hypothetical protein